MVRSSRSKNSNCARSSLLPSMKREESFLRPDVVVRLYPISNCWCVIHFLLSQLMGVCNTHFSTCSCNCFLLSLLFSFCFTDFLGFCIFTCMYLFVRGLLQYVREPSLAAFAHTTLTSCSFDLVAVADVSAAILVQVCRHCGRDNLDIVVSGSGRPVLVHKTTVISFHKLRGAWLPAFSI